MKYKIDNEWIIPVVIAAVIVACWVLRILNITGFDPLFGQDIQDVIPV